MRRFLPLAAALLLAPLLTWSEDAPALPKHLNASELDKVYRRFAALEDTTAFSFCVMGDSRDGDRFHKKLIRQLNAEDALFVLNNGDLVPSGKPEQFAAFVEMISKAKLPYLVSPGNHDYKGDGEKHYEAVFGPRYYAFDLGANRFVVLDNASGTLDDAQLDWMDGQLDTKRRCFVFMHAPPALGQWKLHCFRGGAKRFMEIVEARKPARVFVSHIHGYDAKKWKGVRFVLTGGAGAPQIATFLVEGVALGYHYVKVTVTGEGVEDRRVDMKK